MPAGTVYTFTALPSEVAAGAASDLPNSNIEVHFNQLLRGIKEIQACLNSGTAGTDANGTPLQNYTGLGVIERLTAIEDGGKLQDSDKLQIGSSLTAGDRYARFVLGALSTYKELFYDNSGALFKLRDQSGVLQRLQLGTPTASDDAATKSYVDGLLSANIFSRSMWCGTPIKTGNKTFSISHIYGYDSTGTHVLSKSTPSTIDMANNGDLGLATSGKSGGITGTISVTSSSDAVTGSGTSFTTDFIPGDWIVTAGSAARKILSVTDNTNMTVTTNFSATESGVTYSRGGVSASNGWELNLYALGHWSGQTGFFLSTRNTIGGDTLVDLPRFIRTGTASVTSGSPIITGVGTSFTTEFIVGDKISLVSGGTFLIGTILSIESDTQITMTANSSVSLSAYDVYALYQYYRQLPFSPLLDGSANQINYSVRGFPWNTVIQLPDASLSVVSGHTSTSNTSKNVITNNLAPVLTTHVDVVGHNSIVSTATVPSFFQFGSASGAYNWAVFPTEFTYNSGSNTVNTAGRMVATVPLDSSNQIWYNTTSTNSSGSIFLIGVHLGRWS